MRVDLHQATRSTSARSVRPRARRHRRLGRAPRRAARRHRQLPDHLRHLPRSPERLRVRHQPGRHRVRRPGHQRRAGRRRPGRRPDAVGRLGQRLQHQLGRRLEGAHEDHRAAAGRAEFAIPFRTLRYPAGDRPDLGHQLPAQHPAPQRARVLGADPAPVQPLPRVAGRLARRRPDAGAAQLQASRRTRSATRSQSGVKPVDAETARRRRRRPEVQPHAEPDARRHRQHRLRAGRGRRSAGQPRSLQPVLPGEAAVLPRERRLLHRRQPRRGRSVLQPPHRHRRRRRSRFRSSAAAASRARPGKFNVGLLNMQTDDFEDTRAEQQLQRGARQPRPAQPLVDRRASSSTAQATGDLAASDRLQPDLRASTASSGIGQNDDGLGLLRAKTDTAGRRRRATTPSTCGRRPTCRSGTSTSATRRWASGFNPADRLPEPRAATASPTCA